MPTARAGQASDRRRAAAKLVAAASKSAAAGKHDDAFKKLDAAFKYNAANIVAHRLYQDLMLAAGKRKEMLERYARSKTNKKNRRLLALVHYMEARAKIDPKLRRDDLESIFKLNPRHFWAAYDLVAACTEAGDMAAAEKYARTACELRQLDADVRNVLGNVLLQAGKLAEAEKEFKEALRLRPSFAEPLYNLGLVRSSQKKYREAAEYFKKASEAKKSFPEAHNNRGHALARLGKLDLAIKAYEQATKIKPDYGSAWNNMSVAYYRKKDCWKAWECLQKAEKHGHVPHEVYKRVLRKKLFPDKKQKPDRKRPSPAEK